MAQTKVTIISNAITLLGHTPIVSLDAGDSMVVSAEQAYDLLLPSVLSSNNWRFAVTSQQLSQSIETAPFPWKTVYLLPANWLKTIRVIPNIYVWDIYENSKIYAQYSGVWYMDYVFQPDLTQLLPAHFATYFVYEIAAYLALSSAQRPDLYAPLEAKRIAAFGMCAAIEAQNRPNFSLATFPAIKQRNIGTIIGNNIAGA